MSDRLAALLHDIGHYPLSHAMEDAIRNHYAEAYFTTEVTEDQGENGGEAGEPLIYDHERAGRAVLRHDAEIRTALQGHGFDPDDISAIFMREDPGHLKNLISSDLDADRIDYLLRTAHHAGLPYGSVDVFYILTQLGVDSIGRICLDQKAISAADHFLLCEYFDYQQVSYHKTVASFELILKDVLYSLLQERYVSASAQDIRRKIEDGSWTDFDDSHIMDLMRRYAEEGENSANRRKAKAILTRDPPKLLFQYEELTGREKSKQQFFNILRSVLREKIPVWAQETGIDEDYWMVWERPGLQITKIGSHIPVSAMEGEGSQDRDRDEQAIRILGEDGNSKEIMSRPGSLMSILANDAWYCLRLYVILPKERKSDRQDIKRKITNDIRKYGGLI